MQTIEEMIIALADWLVRNTAHKNFEKNLLLYEAMHDLYQWQGENFFVVFGDYAEMERVVFQNKVKYEREELEELKGKPLQSVINVHRVKNVMRTNTKQSVVMKKQDPLGISEQLNLIGD